MEIQELKIHLESVVHSENIFKPDKCPNCGRYIESMKWFDIRKEYPDTFKRIKHC